jgi:hypothetical protein
MLLHDSLALSIHVILDSQKSIAAGLKDTTEFEPYRNSGGRGEEPPHFHRVTE